MRLDKLLANMGYGTRKESKKLLKAGHVLVNGRLVKDGSIHIDPEQDTIVCQGEEVIYKPYIYLMLNKPPGVVSATEDRMEKTVVDLLDTEEQGFKPFPVGRLDKDTEGLLLLTNDGKLAHQLLSPKKHIPKTYYVGLDQPATAEDQLAFRKGVILDDGYHTLPAELRFIDRTEPCKVELTIYEGKFHQVKRMFLSRGKQVNYLKRIAMGNLGLDASLALGQYRPLTTAEVELLKEDR